MEHTHIDSKGHLHKCLHECKNQMSTPSFWVLFTLSFPIEHLLWKLPPFSYIANLIGMT